MKWIPRQEVDKVRLPLVSRMPVQKVGPLFKSTSDFLPDQHVYKGGSSFRVSYASSKSWWPAACLGLAVSLWPEQVVLRTAERFRYPEKNLCARC